MNRKKRWRVRVYRKIEDWVDVQADSVEEAEKGALVLPGVLSVIAGNTMSGEKPVGQIVHQSIADDDE